MIACVTLGGKRPSHANIGIRQVLGQVRDTVSTAVRLPDLAELERPALEAALAIDDPYLLLSPWLPHFDPLRTDPRFVSFLGRVRLVC